MYCDLAKWATSHDVVWCHNPEDLVRNDIVICACVHRNCADVMCGLSHCFLLRRCFPSSLSFINRLASMNHYCHSISVLS